MRRNRVFLLLLGAAILLVALGACQPAEPEIITQIETQEVVVVETQEVKVNVPVEFVMESERLAAVKSNGVLRCGVNSGVPGFGFLNEAGEFVGFDTDFCRALAVAIFGEPSVEFRPLTAAERFTALQTGEIDVLIRNTTWTFSRDVELGTDFGTTTFYDGQGMMVRRDSGFDTLADMDGATVSQLAGLRTTMAVPTDHKILPETMSKEPLGPVWAQGDQQWGDLVRWVTNGLIIAEEKGITSANVAEIAEGSPTDPEVSRLLGLEGEFGALLGLAPDFMVDVISAVGNYGEIYERHLGPDGTDIPRAGSFNALARDGGVLYAPPWR